MRPVRTAVVGVGHLGRVHARLLAGVEEAALVAVVDSAEEHRRQAAEETGAEPCADVDAIIGRVDAAIVAVPTRWHREVAAQLLQAGVHVLVEKPLAATAAAAAELVDLAQRHGAILQVGHIERFNPVWSKVLPHLREPKFISATRTSGYTFRSTDIGAVLDLMIHDIDLALWLTQSRVLSVEALGVALFGREEDAAHARLVFENGCVAVLSACRASYQVQRAAQLWSRRAYASVDLGQRSAELIRPSDALLRHDLELDALSGAEIARWRDRLLAEHLPREVVKAEDGNPLLEELREFIASVSTGKAPRVSGEAGLAAVEVAERVLSSIAEHAWDGHETGPVGPLAVPTPAVLPGPHWRLRNAPHTVTFERREAG